MWCTSLCATLYCLAQKTTACNQCNKLQTDMLYNVVTTVDQHQTLCRGTTQNKTNCCTLK